MYAFFALAPVRFGQGLGARAGGGRVLVVWHGKGYKNEMSVGLEAYVAHKEAEGK